MRGKDVRAAAARMGISLNGLADLIGLNRRNMRRYANARQPEEIPRFVELAIMSISRWRSLDEFVPIFYRPILLAGVARDEWQFSVGYLVPSGTLMMDRRDFTPTHWQPIEGPDIEQ